MRPFCGNGFDDEPQPLTASTTKAPATRRLKPGWSEVAVCGSISMRSYGVVNGDRSVSLGGLGVIFRVTGEETGGAFAVVEHPIEPGILVPPHVHEREDELTYVIEGEIGARVGERELALRAGEYLYKPRQVPHAFWNASVRPARILDVIVPAGFERFFAELAELIARAASAEEIDEAGRRYGHTMVPEWIPELESRYGVRVRGSPAPSSGRRSRRRV